MRYFRETDRDPNTCRIFPGFLFFAERVKATPGAFPEPINIDGNGLIGFFRAGYAFFLPHPVEINKTIQKHYKTVQFRTNSASIRYYFLSLFPLVFWLY
jgi:hypothetical protein